MIRVVVCFRFRGFLRKVGSAWERAMERRGLLLADWTMLVVKAAVLTAALGHALGPVLAGRPAGAHPGHAYFEQPCCGHSHLRHHKGVWTRGEGIFGAFRGNAGAMWRWEPVGLGPLEVLPMPKPVFTEIIEILRHGRRMNFVPFSEIMKKSISL